MRLYQISTVLNFSILVHVYLDTKHNKNAAEIIIKTNTPFARQSSEENSVSEKKNLRITWNLIAIIFSLTFTIFSLADSKGTCT